MSTNLQIEISKLSLDLKNYRTVPQKKEADAIKAMISIKPERFFAVLESLIEDGYLPTENIIVLKDGENYVVKEGNRRIAALKLIHGIYKSSDFGLPSSIIDSISKLDSNWKSENIKVPCTIFSLKEADKVDKVVTLAHGKGEKASRDPWNSVARARHNRDVKGGSEAGLDLLEKYLKKGNNLNNQQKERYGGEYKLSILDEALRKIHSRLNFQNSSDLATKYPNVPYLLELEKVMLDIGLELLTFDIIRNQSNDFPSNYGIPSIVISTNTNNTKQTENSVTANPNTTTITTSPVQSNTVNNANPLVKSTPTIVNSNQNNSPASSSPVTNNTITSNIASTSVSSVKSTPKALAVNDPKQISNLLKKFAPRGANRQKVVTLRDEIRKLKISDNPIAFCFLLRSMFEISAKAYSIDNNLPLTKSGGKDKSLVELLRGITAHITNNNANTAMVKILHGAMTEIGKTEGILSVTSMNQLVHNPAFSIVPSDVCIMFGNIYPLLESMN